MYSYILTCIKIILRVPETGQDPAVLGTVEKAELEDISFPEVV